MEENFSVEWNVEWKKIASVEYGKIVLHSIPFHSRVARISQRGLFRKFDTTVNELDPNFYLS